MAEFWEKDDVVAPSSSGDEFWKADPVAKTAAPVTADNLVRSAAHGIPILGGAMDNIAATMDAVTQPVLGRGSGAGTLSARRAANLKAEAAKSGAFSEQHPYVDTAAELAGGVGAFGGAAKLPGAARVLGLEGTLPQMVKAGALSNAAIGAADSAVRGTDPTQGAIVGGAVGAALPVVARGVGAAARGIKGAFTDVPVVPQRTVNVAGVDVPLTASQATGDAAMSADEQLIRHGNRGDAARTEAQRFAEDAAAKIKQAGDNIGAGLDPQAAIPRPPAEAANRVAAELADQANLAAAGQAENANASAMHRRAIDAQVNPKAQGRVAPFDAAQNIAEAVPAARDAKVAETQALYKQRDAIPGTFDESVPKGLAEDIRSRLNTGENPLWVDPTNESTANKALKLIDQTLGKDSGIFSNAVDARPAASAPVVGAARPAVDDTIEALRAKFGDSVAEAYAKQNSAQPVPHSLIEFIASKGGLTPHPELDAIGLTHGHRSQIPGQPGFFGVVRKNGTNIDRMREAAEEAGYFRGSQHGTSTPTEFLDAIDAEMRGQKRYPEGFENFTSKRDLNVKGAREQAEWDRINHGHEEDLAAAGHDGLGPDVKQRAVSLMRDEGMHPDDAVENAFRQLEQEDATGAVRSSFPGDTAASSATPTSAKPVSLRTMDEARKRLVTMYGDAKSAAMRSGDKSDMRAMGKILHEFDNSIGDALSAGKFSGDAATAKSLQDAARRSHAEYRQTFSSKGPGDETGRAVEKILGRYSDSAATPEEIAQLSYGPANNPGDSKSARVASRLRDILGPNSKEWGQYKQGLVSHLDDVGDGMKPRSFSDRADRIEKYLGTSHALSILEPADRVALKGYAKQLRTMEPKPGDSIDKVIARIAGTDGNRAMSAEETLNTILSSSIPGKKSSAFNLATRLKKTLPKDAWDGLRYVAWKRTTEAGEGKIPFGEQMLQKRISEMLNSGLSDVLFTKAEQHEMRKLADAYAKMVPVKGTTNPSGSAHIGAKIAKKAASNLFAMMGFAAHGPAGLLVGHGADKLAAARASRAGLKDARRLFYGNAPRAPLVTGNPLGGLLPGGLPAIEGQ